MNVAQLSGWFEANKKPVLIVGAAVAGGLGLMRARKNAAGGAVSPGAATPTSSRGTALSTGPAIAGSVPYDSTANDLASFLGPQLEQIQQSLAQTPVPANNIGPGFYRVAGGTTVYQVDDQGNRDWLELPEYKTLIAKTGAPVTEVGKDSNFWARTKLVGTDSAEATQLGLSSKGPA